MTRQGAPVCGLRNRAPVRGLYLAPCFLARCTRRPTPRKPEWLTETRSSLLWLADAYRCASGQPYMLYALRCDALACMARVRWSRIPPPRPFVFSLRPGALAWHPYLVCLRILVAAFPFLLS
jgi:hypothetical protein